MRATLEREEGGAEYGSGLDASPRRARRSAMLHGLTRTHRRRARRVVVILAMVFLFGVGYSSPSEQETFQSVTRPLTHPEGPSVPPSADSASSAVRSVEKPPVGEAREEKQLALQPPSEPAETCDELRVLVDRSHTLPPEYVPQDLIALHEYQIPHLGSEVLKLRKQAAHNLNELIKAAAADGEELVVASAYRSYQDQRISHDRLASVYGAQHADGLSATPGHSQHQLGTAVDFTNAAAAYQVWEPFGQTSASEWLEEHAHEYGYVLAYPSGKERETGFQWEPWHYRYIGERDAGRLKQSGGLSLQAFLEREGVAPRC